MFPADEHGRHRRPDRGRPQALERALRSIAPQATAANGEVVVVEDGGDAARVVAARHGAGFVRLGSARGPNAARNAGIVATDADLVVLTEDDVEAPPGWLSALLGAAGAHPVVEVFGGPIRGRIDGRAWRTCGREWPPISSFWRGGADREVDLVYAGNMAIRRSALLRVGPFAESLGLYADEARRIARATGGPPPTRDSSATRRSGRTAIAPAAGGSCTSPRRASTTCARATRPVPARSCAPPTAAGEWHAAGARAADARHRSRANSVSWAARFGTSSCGGA